MDWFASVDWIAVGAFFGGFLVKFLHGEFTKKR